jgi:hypothetical protein
MMRGFRTDVVPAIERDESEERRMAKQSVEMAGVIED